LNPGLLGLIAALCWGTGDFAARFMTRAIGAAQTLMIISAVAAIGLAPVVMDRDLSPLWEPTTLTLTVLAGLSTAAGALLLYKSLERGPLGVVVPMTSSYPLPLVLVVMALGELTLTLPLAAAMAATIGGVWVVARSGHQATYNDDHAQGSIAHSMMLAGSAAVILAFAILITEAAVSRAGEVEVIWLTRLVELLVLAIAITLRRQFRPISKRMWALLIVMGVVDTIGFLALFSAHGTGDTTIAAIASSAYGVVTVGLARLVLKEPVKPLQWLGFAIVICGAASLTMLSS
jgi:drug/metabolite transporter (DMT)-like permease